jgi:hypothetical protein
MSKTMWLIDVVRLPVGWGGGALLEPSPDELELPLMPAQPITPERRNTRKMVRNSEKGYLHFLVMAALGRTSTTISAA